MKLPEALLFIVMFGMLLWIIGTLIERTNDRLCTIERQLEIAKECELGDHQ